MIHNTNYVPQDINELLPFNSYMIGGLRKLGIKENDIEDRLNDVYLHCITTRFFIHVNEKVALGLMDPKQFRAYLGITLKNCVINGYTKNKKNPSIGAVSTTVPENDDFGGMIDLDRHSSMENGEDFPQSFIEEDFVKYLIQTKPGIVPVFYLKLMGYKPPEIALVINKRKETVHYRIKAIQESLKEYLELSGKTYKEEKEDPETKSDSQARNIYTVILKDNPYQKWGSGFHIYDAVKLLTSGFEFNALCDIVRGLIHEGKIKTRRNIENVAWGFIETAKAYNVLSGEKIQKEVKNIEPLVKIPPQKMDKVYTIKGDNPYKYGINFCLWEELKGKAFNSSELEPLVSKLLDTKEIESSRTPFWVGYHFLNNVEKQYPSHLEIKENEGFIDEPDSSFYKLKGNNPFKRGTNHILWEKMTFFDTWNWENLENEIEKGIEKGVIPNKDIPLLRHNFLNTVKRWYPNTIEGL